MMPKSKAYPYYCYIAPIGWECGAIIQGSHILMLFCPNAVAVWCNSLRFTDTYLPKFGRRMIVYSKVYQYCCNVTPTARENGATI